MCVDGVILILMLLFCFFSKCSFSEGKFDRCLIVLLIVRLVMNFIWVFDVMLFF